MHEIAGLWSFDPDQETGVANHHLRPLTGRFDGGHHRRVEWIRSNHAVHYAYRT